MQKTLRKKKKQVSALRAARTGQVPGITTVVLQYSSAIDKQRGKHDARRRSLRPCVALQLPTQNATINTQAAMSAGDDSPASSRKAEV